MDSAATRFGQELHMAVCIALCYLHLLVKYRVQLVMMLAKVMHACMSHRLAQMPA